MSLLHYFFVAVYLAWLGHRYLYLFDVNKQLQSSTPMASLSPSETGTGTGTGKGTCQFLGHTTGGEVIIPTEDLVLYRPGVLIGKRQ